MPFLTSNKEKFSILVTTLEKSSIDSRADAVEKVTNSSLDSAFTLSALLFFF